MGEVILRVVAADLPDDQVESMAIDELHDIPAEVWVLDKELVVEDSFIGLVDAARHMLEKRYPADVFVDGPTADSGVRFVAKLREALTLVHAEPDEATPGPVVSEGETR